MFCRRSARTLPVAVALVAVAGCRMPDPDVVAAWSGGNVTRAELDAWLSRLPSTQRQPPDGLAMDGWLAERIGDLVLPRIVSRRARQAEQSRLPSVRLRARYEASQRIGREYLRASCPSREISEEQIADAFRAQFPQAPRPWILVRHIYRRSLPSATVDQRRAVRRRLEEVLSALRNGASFIEQARLHSDSETAEQGGLIGRLSHRAPVEPAVLQAAWALDDGAYSGIVEVDNGFHIVMREGSGVEPPQPLEDVRAQLERQLDLARRERCGKEVLAGLEGATPVSIDRAALQAQAPESVVLRIGDEAFSNRQLQGLAADGQPLALSPRPGEALRHFSEAVLLATAALATDSRTQADFSRVEREATERLIREAQWHAERRRFVLELPEADLQRYFERNRERFHSDLQLDVGLLVIDSESPTERRQAFERAQEMAARLRRGESFERLAEAHSVHWSSGRGGRLDLLPLPRAQVILGSRAAAVASRLKIGEISSPVLIAETPRARYAVLKLYQRRQPRAREFEQVRDQVIETMAQERVQQLDRQVRAKLLAESGLEISEIGLRRYVDELSGS